MAMTTISMRVDEDVKKKAQELYKSIGLDLSSAINLFLVQSIRVNGLPFNVLAPNEIKKEN